MCHARGQTTLKGHWASWESVLCFHHAIWSVIQLRWKAFTWWPSYQPAICLTCSLTVVFVVSFLFNSMYVCVSFYACSVSLSTSFQSAWHNGFYYSELYQKAVCFRTLSTLNCIGTIVKCQLALLSKCWNLDAGVFFFFYFFLLFFETWLPCIAVDDLEL